MPNHSKYRIESGVPRRVYGARKQIERDGHTLAVSTLTDVKATMPQGEQHWAFEVRRGRMTVYGGLLRFLDALHRKGVSKEIAMMIPGWLTEYIDCLWGSGTPTEQRIRKVG